MVSEVGRITYGSSSSLPPAMRHHRQLRRKSLHVFGFFLQKALRDQQRHINVLVAGGLDAIVQLALQALPDRVAIGLDHHAAFDDLGRLGHVAQNGDVLIPGGKIFFSWCNRGFGHVLLFLPRQVFATINCGLSRAIKSFHRVRLGFRVHFQTAFANGLRSHRADGSDAHVI